MNFRLLALLLAVFLVCLALTEAKKPKKAKKVKPSSSDEVAADMMAEEEEETEDEDDDEENINSANFGSRKDCIDDDELEECSEECEDHEDCRRESFNMECDSQCGAMCRYVEKHNGEKCVINLTAHISEFRTDERYGKTSRG